MTQKEFQKQFGGEIKGKWLVFKGYLSCHNNQLKSLPDNLKVEGNLYCYNNQLKSLPDNLKVEGNLYCSDNQLKSLPDNLKVEGNLYCSDNQLKSLPANLKVGGCLYCYNNQLKSLPDNLKVGGSLDCHNNQLKSLPDNLKVGGYLYPFDNTRFITEDIPLINKILKDQLTAEEVFKIENTEHRRIAYERMDKTKMKELKNYKVLDAKKDRYGHQMKIISFAIEGFDSPFKFLNCICPSTKREYFIETQQDNCILAKNMSFGISNKRFKFDKEY